MITLITVASWLLIGLGLDAAGVFDDDSHASGHEHDPDLDYRSTTILEIAGADAVELAEDDEPDPDQEPKRISDAEMGERILEEELGADFLTRFADVVEETPNSTTPANHVNAERLISDAMVFDSAVTDASDSMVEPTVSVAEIDHQSEAIVLAYDPVFTPNPDVQLLDSDDANEKMLLLNGVPMAHLRNAANVTLADVNLVETTMTV